MTLPRGLTHNLWSNVIESEIKNLFPQNKKIIHEGIFAFFFSLAAVLCSHAFFLLLLVLRRSLQIPIPAWAMKATVFSSSGRGPYSFVCMSTLSLQMDCLTLLYSLQSCSTCWAVSAACPHEQRSVSPILNIL